MINVWYQLKIGVMMTEALSQNSKIFLPIFNLNLVSENSLFPFLQQPTEKQPLPYVTDSGIIMVHEEQLLLH